MTPITRSQIVKQLAGELGFDRCGIAAAGPITREAYLRDWLDQGRAGTMAWLHKHVDSRSDVRAWLPWATSVVVVALNYKQTAPPPAPETHGDDKGIGRVAMYAWGEDYHTVLRHKLSALIDALREKLAEPFQARICVDTSAVIERELAAAAGIGWIGKNTLVLSPELGSYFFLGVLILDMPLAPDAPQTDHCGTCTRCIDACPTQAFPQPYRMDASRCISYLTIEHRGDIAPELSASMGDWVFGCDVCQEVCPHNGQTPVTREPRFAAGPQAAAPRLHDLLNEDLAGYRSRVDGQATQRAKFDMWKRNAAIARQNASGGRGR